LPGERNARNNARCTQARKITKGLDRQHQDVDRTPCGKVNQNDWRIGEINGESTSMVWPTLGSRTAKEQNNTVGFMMLLQYSAYVYCGKTTGFIRIPFGTEVGLSRGDIVLDRDPATPYLKGLSPQFSAHVRCDQTAGCIKMPIGMEVGLSPGDFVLNVYPAP